MSCSHRAPNLQSLHPGPVITTSLIGIRSTPTFVCQGTGSRSIKQTKSLLRECRSLQSITKILQEHLSHSDGSGDAAHPLLVTMAVQVLALTQAGAQPLSQHGAPSPSSGGEEEEDMRTMRAFMEEHLPAWLATSPPPPPLHLVAVLHALLLLDGGGGGGQGLRQAVSPKVKAAVKAVVSEPAYLHLASTQPAFMQSVAAAAREAAAPLSDDAELHQGSGGQYPALVALLYELGMRKCLGGGLGDLRLRRLLWPKGEDARGRLQAHGLALCRNFGVTAAARGSGGAGGGNSGGGGAALPASTEGYISSSVWPAAAEEYNGEEMGEQPQEADDGSSDNEGWEDEEAASDSELDDRIRAKSSFLLDLDFLNQRLPEEQRIEVRLLPESSLYVNTHPLAAVLCPRP